MLHHLLQEDDLSKPFFFNCNPNMQSIIKISNPYIGYRYQYFVFNLKYYIPSFQFSGDLLVISENIWHRMDMF